MTDKNRDRALERLLVESLNKGRDIPVNDSFWKNLRIACLKIKS